VDFVSIVSSLRLKFGESETEEVWEPLFFKEYA
jgi:hypothetical protein